VFAVFRLEGKPTLGHFGPQWQWHVTLAQSSRDSRVYLPNLPLPPTLVVELTQRGFSLTGQGLGQPYQMGELRDWLLSQIFGRRYRVGRKR
jgi:hypothetical protein